MINTDANHNSHNGHKSHNGDNSHGSGKTNASDNGDDGHSLTDGAIIAIAVGCSMMCLCLLVACCYIRHLKLSREVDLQDAVDDLQMDDEQKFSLLSIDPDHEDERPNGGAPDLGQIQTIPEEETNPNQQSLKAAE